MIGDMQFDEADFSNRLEVCRWPMLFELQFQQISDACWERIHPQRAKMTLMIARTDQPTICSSNWPALQ
jgi:hypothetical protein